MPEGDQVVPVANWLIGSGRYDLVVASQDWHPSGHGSCFVTPGKQPLKSDALWQAADDVADHCVAAPPMPTSIRLDIENVD